jgi:tetratricopeptide (TPR) repeat protein
MIRVLPNRQDGYFLRAMAYYRLGDYDMAIADNSKVISMATPRSVIESAHYNRGLDYEKKREYQKALADFNLALALNPGNSDAFANRAACYQYQGDPESGKVESDRDYRMSAQRSGKLIASGNNYLNTHDYSAAEDDFKAAAAANRCEPVGWSNMAWALYLEGKVKQAISTNETAIKIDPSFTIPRLNMGLYYAVQNDWDSAQQQYSIGLKYASSTDISSGLADIRDAKAKYADSAATLERSQELLQGARSAGSAPMR